MKVPSYVEKVLDRLHEHGFEAYSVGGCVRDMMMGKTPNDYDITTSARPEQTAVCFSDHRVIETGIKHGTVTVISDGNNVEITTYRLDGEYEDNRRPKEVEFTSDLLLDLSRRDFTINAMAYSPRLGFVDEFDGANDIEKKIVRCVGDPEKRFSEDGLRILRALRFSSVLDFSIDEDTEKAIHKLKHLLKNISTERIHVEFTKLLSGAGACRILTEYRDVIEVFIPSVSNITDEKYSYAVHIATACKYKKADGIEERHLKYAAFLGLLGGTRLITDTLAFFNSDTKSRTLSVSIFEEYLTDHKPNAHCIRYALSRVGYPILLQSIALSEAVLTVTSTDKTASETLKNIALIAKEEALRPDRCISVSELKIGGRELISMGIKGAAIGKTLTHLLSLVIEDKISNIASELAEAAKKFIECELM